MAKTILIIDDEHPIQRLLEIVLKKAGYAVTVLSNGTDAIDLLQDTLPDLIISDIMMPGIDGITLCRRLKDNPSTSQIPIIMLSIHRDHDTRSRCYEAGANLYISKPFIGRDFLTRIRSVL